jgi:NAD(P)-dependent dehydrogenase (short-subunit alcohol dehydrogenase family)
MDLGLRGKPIVVVGGTGGMGYEAARVLAEEGARVAIIGRDAAKAERKAAALRDAGGDVQALTADATHPDQIGEAIDAAVGRLGGLYGLAVANGPMHKTGPFLEYSETDWMEYFQSTFMGTVRSCQAALPHIVGRGGGAMVLTASYSTRATVPGLTPYIAMKSAVTAVAKNLSMEFGKAGVRVNCICPGAIATEALDHSIALAVQKYGEPADAAINRYMIDEWKMDVALQRIGKPIELGELYAFLLSERAGYLTGATINQDGGTQYF